MLRILWCVFLFTSVQSQDTKCVTSNGEEGKCIYLPKCPSAQRDLTFKIYPQICSFNQTSKIPTVCCIEEDIPSRENLTILQYSSPIKPGDSQDRKDEEGCLPLTISVNREPKVELPQGHLSWQKCLEYQDKIVLPCKAGQREPTNFCDVFYEEDKIVGGGGKDAEENEFPHMALLGYGKTYKNAIFGCGASLISEKFLLTAGHCTYSKEFGNLSFAVLGLLRREDAPVAPTESIYGIKRIVKHPEFAPPSKYHDIALLELDREVPLSIEVHPACLHVGTNIKEKRAYATGWGLLGYNLENANILQNVPLWEVPDEKCKSKFPKHRHFLRGYDNVTQMCYGDDGSPRDTCTGDSGGPIQIKSPNIYCMYLILGVTSFGSTSCAQVGFPGVYTRVAHYIPWIEGVVWPQSA